MIFKQKEVNSSQELKSDVVTQSKTVSQLQKKVYKSPRKMEVEQKPEQQPSPASKEKKLKIRSAIDVRSPYLPKFSVSGLFFCWQAVKIGVVVYLLVMMPTHDDGLRYLTDQAERLVSDWTAPLMKKLTVVDQA